MTLSVETAIKVAATHASSDITRAHLRPVVVEPLRVWACDGHRAIVLSTVADPAELGHYVEGVKLSELAPIPSIDQVLPKVEPPVNLTLAPKQVDDLRALAWMLDRHTHAIIRFRSQSDAAQCVLDRSTAKRRAQCRLELPNMPVACSHDFGIALAYLLEAIDAVHFGASADVPLRQSREQDAIIIQGERGFSLVMPCRI